MDMLGRFDTKTGKVIEYPVPHAEIAMREFFRDSQGRMWYGTNPNNKVGYFLLSKQERRNRIRQQVRNQPLKKPWSGHSRKANAKRELPEAMATYCLPST